MLGILNRAAVVAFILVAGVGLGESNAADLQQKAISDNQTQRLPWLTVKGNQAFTRDQLVDELASHLEFLLATHALAVPDAVSSTIERLLVDGYLNSGFGDVKVTAQGRKATGVSIRIEEGPQYQCGPLVLQGADEIGAQRLVDRLRSKQPPHDTFPVYEFVDGVKTVAWVNADGHRQKLGSALWPSDEDASFGDEEARRKAIKAALADLGYSQAQFEQQVTRDQTTGAATLRIVIHDPGPRDRIDEIVVTGLKVNDPHHLLKTLEIAQGDLIDRETLSRINSQLWSSGRFLKHKTFWKRNENPRTLQLHIEVEEFPGLPPVHEQLNREAQAYLWAYRWLSGFTGGGKEFVVSGGVGPWELTSIHSNGGMMIRLARASDSGPGDVIAVMVDGENLLLANSLTESKFHGRFVSGESRVNLQASFGAADNEESLMSLNFGGSISSDRVVDESPVRLALRLSPARFAALGYKSQLNHTWQGDLLTARSEKKDYFEIDQSRKHLQIHTAGFAVTIEDGRFEKEADALLKRTEDFDDRYDSAAPLGSFCSYLLDPELHLSINEHVIKHPGFDRMYDRQLASAIKKLVDAGLLDGLDSVIRSEDSQPDVRFVIRDDPPKLNGLKQMIIHFAAQAIVSGADKVFDEHSWPMLVTREAGFVAIGRTEFANHTLKLIYESKSYGPLCHGTVAWLLRFVKPQLSPQFAIRALQRMDEEHFTDDFADLMHGDWGAWMREMIVAIQQLEPREMESLAEIAGNQRLAAVLQTIYLSKELRIDRDAGSIWFDAIRDDLESWLRSMVSSVPAS